MAGSSETTGNEYTELYIVVSRDDFNKINSKRFKSNITVYDLKSRLEIICGRQPDDMCITLLDCDKREKCKLTDENRTLSSYHALNGDTLLVEGTDFVKFDDNLEERFQLTDDQYLKRKGTLREFLIQNKVGKYNPEHLKHTASEIERLKEEKQERMQKDEKLLESINIGDRCEVNIPGKITSRGIVMYKGKIMFDDELWIGVKYDEPVGKNNGFYNGVKYFDALPKYGDFVSPSYVTVGDFPEICELDDQEF